MQFKMPFCSWEITLILRGNPGKGFVKGVCDEVWNNDQIAETMLTRNMLERCKPISKNFDEAGYMSAIKSMSKGDRDGVTKALTSALRENYDPNCLDVVASVMLKCMMGCPKVLFDSLPQAWY